MQMSCSGCGSPDALLDLGFHGLTHRCNIEHIIVSWEMSLGDEHRNLAFAAWTLNFHGFPSSPRVFGHQQIICWMEPALLLIFAKKTLFAPNFVPKLYDCLLGPHSPYRPSKWARCSTARSNRRSPFRSRSTPQCLAGERKRKKNLLLRRPEEISIS